MLYSQITTLRLGYVAGGATSSSSKAAGKLGTKITLLCFVALWSHLNTINNCFDACSGAVAKAAYSLESLFSCGVYTTNILIGFWCLYDLGYVWFFWQVVY